MPGFWKRPMTRTYSYNLEVGEHYYNPMTSYLEAERGTRGETPGALTYSERLARKWLTGRRYGATEVSDRYLRASSVSRGEAMAAAEVTTATRMARARSVAASAATTDAYNVSAWANRKELLGRAIKAQGLAEASCSRAEAVTAAEKLRKQSYVRQSKQVSSAQASSSSSTSVQQSKKETTAKVSSSSSTATATKKVMKQQQQQKSVQIQSSQQSQQQTSTRMAASKTKIEDDICKKVADVHMKPWSAGAELDEAQSASARAKARILDLERELDEITRRALSAQTHACKTAAAMAKEAMAEDQMAMSSSYKKSKKVMVESATKIKA